MLTKKRTEVKEKKKSIIHFLSFFLGITFGTSFGVYIWFLYSQLLMTFAQQEQSLLF